MADDTKTRSLRDELSSLKIDRGARPVQGRGRNGLFWAAGVLVALLVAAFAWRATLGAETEVEVVFATRQQAVAGGGAAASGQVVLQGSGYVVTGNKYISIGVRVPGRIDAYLVDESEAVKTGQPLVQLDRRDYEAALERAKAALELARANEALAATLAERQQALRAEDVSSQSSLDVRESEWRVARARVREAEAALEEATVNLDYTTLRAPRDGVVLAKLKEVGEMAVPGGFAGSGDLIRMADLSDLRAEVDVNELDIGKIALGQRASVTPDAFPDRRYAAEVVKLYPQINRQKGTLKVEVRLLERDETLRPDSSVRIAFLAEAPKRAEGAPPEALVTVPKSAVREGGVVWVVTEGRLRRQAVRLGVERDGVVVVEEGLLGGEAVVVGEDGPLADGAAVQISATGTGRGPG
ncbi:MAG: efflux RND transporter periplasmic adaptor subunit [Deltaproteobacteria bacterium]|nr:efflux RND transporter periplasmic adaptor subunit [Deltaproteobacteria bacterium]